MYASVARDFGGSPEAWDLRARRHTLGLPSSTSPAARAAAVRAAVGVYQEGLAAVRTPEMAGHLLAFLQQQMAALDEDAGASSDGRSSGAAAAEERRDAAEWLRQRTQEAFEEAAADGLLTEALRLDGIAYFLHCGDSHAALAAARAGTHALPQSAALWQQLLVLEAVLAAEQLAGSGSGSPGQGEGQQRKRRRTTPTSGDSSSDEEEEEEGASGKQQQRSSSSTDVALPGLAAASIGPAQRRLEETALQALTAVPAAEAVPVWLTALGVLGGGGCSLQGLAQALVDAAMRQARGPAEVCAGCVLVAAGGGHAAACILSPDSSS